MNPMNKFITVLFLVLSLGLMVACIGGDEGDTVYTPPESQDPAGLRMSLFASTDGLGSVTVTGTVNGATENVEVVIVWGDGRVSKVAGTSIYAQHFYDCGFHSEGEGTVYDIVATANEFGSNGGSSRSTTATLTVVPCS